MLSWQAHSSAPEVHCATTQSTWLLLLKLCGNAGVSKQGQALHFCQKSCTLICYFVKDKAAIVNKFLCLCSLHLTPQLMESSQSNILPAKKKSGWQKSWLHSVPSQQIKNRMREAQRNQDSLLQTGIVFISKAGQKRAVQTAEIWTSQTVQVFAQCTAENDAANIIYGIKFFNSQKLHLCEIQSLWLWSRYFIKAVILPCYIWFFQNHEFRLKTKQEALFWKHRRSWSPTLRNADIRGVILRLSAASTSAPACTSSWTTS